MCLCAVCWAVTVAVPHHVYLPSCIWTGLPGRRSTIGLRVLQVNMLHGKTLTSTFLFVSTLSLTLLLVGFASGKSNSPSCAWSLVLIWGSPPVSMWGSCLMWGGPAAEGAVSLHEVMWCCLHCTSHVIFRAPWWFFITSVFFLFFCNGEERLILSRLFFFRTRLSRYVFIFCGKQQRNVCWLSPKGFILDQNTTRPFLLAYMESSEYFKSFYVSTHWLWVPVPFVWGSTC